MARCFLRFLILFLCCATCCGHESIAQSVGPAKPILSLEQAIALALEHNPGIQSARWDEALAKREIALEKKQFSPQLSFSAASDGYYSQDHNHYTILTTPTISLKTPMGTEISLSANRYYNSMNNNSAYPSIYSVNVEQPLLKNRSIKANTRALSDARHQDKVNNLLVKQTKNDLVLDVILRYYALQKAIMDDEVYQLTLNRQRDFEKNVQARIQAGRLAAHDIHAVQLQTHQIQSGLLAAKGRVSQSVLDLFVLLGIDYDAQYYDFTKLKINKQSDNNTISYEGLQEQALCQHTAYQLLLLSHTQAKKQQWFAKEDLKPDLRLGAELGQYKGCNGNADYHDQRVYLKLNYPLGERARKKHQVYKSNLALKKIELDLQVNKKAIVNKLKVIVDEKSQYQKQWVLAQETTKLARLTYQDSVEKFEVGRASLFEMRIQKDNLLEAELREVAAMQALLSIDSHIAYVTGKLLRQWGVDV